MRTKKTFIKNQGLYILNKRFEKETSEEECNDLDGTYKDGKCVFWKETEYEIWFDFSENREGSMVVFGHQLANNSLIIHTDTQHLYQVGERLIIDDVEHKIRQIIKEPIRQKGNKRSTIRQWKYRIEIT